MVSKEDHDKVVGEKDAFNQKVQSYENGLKTELELNDDNLNT